MTASEDDVHNVLQQVMTKDTQKPETASSLIGYAALSKRLGIPTSTLRNMVGAGRIPHVRIGPRTVRFEEKEIEAWLRARRNSQ